MFAHAMLAPLLSLQTNTMFPNTGGHLRSLEAAGGIICHSASAWLAYHAVRRLSSTCSCIGSLGWMTVFTSNCNAHSTLSDYTRSLCDTEKHPADRAPVGGMSGITTDVYNDALKRYQLRNDVAYFFILFLKYLPVLKTATFIGALWIRKIILGSFVYICFQRPCSRQVRPSRDDLGTHILWCFKNILALKQLSMLEYFVLGMYSAAVNEGQVNCEIRKLLWKSLFTYIPIACTLSC